LITDQSPQGLNCSWPGEPPAVPRQDLHWFLEGFNKPSFFTGDKSDSTTAGITLFLPFLAALNKDLAGIFSEVQGEDREERK
jgi:hypothetical protein